jgi:hypothetical protein
MGMVVLQSVFMFCSSMAVFTYIKLGGVVGPDIRKTIRFKDLIFGSYLFAFVGSYYTFKFIFLTAEQRSTYDVHLIHVLANSLLLESLMSNRDAKTYWGQILRRRWNNVSLCCRGARVAVQPVDLALAMTTSAWGPGPSSVRVPAVFTIEMKPM